jgi:hypothetical protein
MQTLPDKNHSDFNSLHQLSLPMDVGVLQAILWFPPVS